MTCRLMRPDAPGPRVWSGTIAVGAEWTLYVGPVGVTASHRHHAFQVLAGGEDAMVEVAGRVAKSMLVVAPDVVHRVAVGSARASLLFVEPQASLGAQLATLRFEDGCHVAGDVDVAVPGFAGWSDALVQVDAVTVGLGVPPTRLALGSEHPVVRAVRDELPATVRGGGVSLAAMAASAGLSASRFGHVFRADTGVTWRAYVRWFRLRVAARALASGWSVTDAAHEAGFADGAHFSRTFRAMFGLSPSQLRHVRWLTEPLNV